MSISNAELVSITDSILECKNGPQPIKLVAYRNFKGELKETKVFSKSLDAEFKKRLAHAAENKVGEQISLTFTQNGKFFNLTNIGAPATKEEIAASKEAEGSTGGSTPRGSFSGGSRDIAGMKAGGIIKSVADMATIDTSEEDLLALGLRLLSVQNQLEEAIKSGSTGAVQQKPATAAPKEVPKVAATAAVSGLDDDVPF